MAKPNPVPTLSRFEGRDVLAATIRVTNAGDGLSAALSVAPQEFTLHEKVYVVLETEVSRVSYEDMKDGGASQRVHVLKTSTASIADGQVVAALLDETRRLLALKREADAAAKGVMTLPGTGVRDEEPSE